MMVVLDTNVLLQALNPRHEHARIMDDWYAGRFVWAVSTDILMEYQEVIVRQSGAPRWDALTWNCTHLANPVLQKELVEYCRYHDLYTPILCTPDSLSSPSL